MRITHSRVLRDMFKPFFYYKQKLVIMNHQNTTESFWNLKFRKTRKYRHFYEDTGQGRRNNPIR